MEKRRVIYYTDELNDEFSVAVIEPRAIDESYKYIHTSIWKRFTHFFWYRIVATPIAYLYTKMAHRHKTVGREKLRAHKGEGYFMYGNHTHHICDAVLPSLISMPKEVYVIVHPNNVSMPYLGRVTPSMGAIPLPDGLKAYRNFIDAIEYRIKEGAAVAIYPEAHIWPYYTDIRPFTDKSFVYPIKLDTPTYAFTNTYKRCGKRKTPRIVTYIDGPFYPDKTLSPRDAQKKLRDEVYRAMKERARLSDFALIKYIKKDDE